MAFGLKINALANVNSCHNLERMSLWHWAFSVDMESRNPGISGCIPIVYRHTAWPNYLLPGSLQSLLVPFGTHYLLIFSSVELGCRHSPHKLYLGCYAAR